MDPIRAGYPRQRCFKLIDPFGIVFATARPVPIHRVLPRAVWLIQIAVVKSFASSVG